MISIFSSTKATLLAALMSLCFVSVISHAAGSFNPSGGNSDHRIYGLGKKVFHKKVICDNCPMPGKSLTKTSAKELIESISSRAEGFQNFKPIERKAAIFYLKKRYKLS